MELEPGKPAPDREDFAQVEREHGKLPKNAPNEEQAKRYRLAQIAKLMRLTESVREQCQGLSLDEVQREKLKRIAKSLTD